jgi:hypothetical protein
MWQVSAQQKDLQGALVKLGKGIDAHLDVDLAGALRDCEFDQDTLNQVGGCLDGSPGRRCVNASDVDLKESDKEVRRVCATR